MSAPNPVAAPAVAALTESLYALALQSEESKEPKESPIKRRTSSELLGLMVSYASDSECYSQLARMSQLFQVAIDDDTEGKVLLRQHALSSLQKPLTNRLSLLKAAYEKQAFQTKLHHYYFSVAISSYSSEASALTIITATEAALKQDQAAREALENQILATFAQIVEVDMAMLHLPAAATELAEVRGDTLEA